MTVTASFQSGDRNSGGPGGGGVLGEGRRGDVVLRGAGGARGALICDHQKGLLNRPWLHLT